VETVVSCGTVPVNCNCVILLKESLPSGLYVDTYQTDNLHQHGAAKVLLENEPHPETNAEQFHVFLRLVLQITFCFFMQIQCCFGRSSDV